MYSSYLGSRFVLVFASWTIVFVVYSLCYYFRPNAHEIHFQTHKAISLKNFITNTSKQKNNRAPASCDQSAKGLTVVIGKDDIAYLDEDTNIDTLIIDGQLHCDQVKAPNVMELKVKTIIVNGLFQCGTAANPYNKKFIISLKDSDLDPKVDHGYRGIIVEAGGKINFSGNRKNAGWYKLAQTVQPGSQEIFVDVGRRIENIDIAPSRTDKIGITSIVPWSVGDEIVIGPTAFNYQEAEKFKITAIYPTNPVRIQLDHPVQFSHWGENQIVHSSVLGSFNLDERGEVANLTRNILIRADESDALIDEGVGPLAQRGGHIMVHYQGQAFIDSVELYKMGQAGVMARYPFHWHYVGNANGQFIQNSSIHHSYQRCITVHRTQNAIVKNNVCFDFKGHGYFLEDGNEVNNQIIHNLAVMAKAPNSNKLLLASDNIATSESQGRFPSVSAFWISNPKNIVKYNTASGSVGTGFWMSFENEVKDHAGNIIARPISEQTTDFSFNTAHSTKVGITWDGAPTGGLTNNPNNPNDRALQSAHYMPPAPTTFQGLIAYKNLLTGIYFRGQSVLFKHNIVADNGWSYWVSYNQIVRDSVFIGETDNQTSETQSFYFNSNRLTGRLRKSGIVLYDGPFEIHHSDFLDFSTEPESYTFSSGSTVNTTVIPFTTTGGTNKFTNLVSDLRFEPEPVWRVHVEDPSENTNGRQYLGNAIIRDLDGSLSGSSQGGVVVATRSLGITPQSGCSDAYESLHNFKFCPPNYKEGSLTFMRWGSPYASPWGTPFLARRNDGAINYLKTEWTTSLFGPNNLIATVLNQNYSYEILPYYQYEYDRSINATAAMDANAEIQSPNSPVVKVVGYGNNCKLLDGAVDAGTMQALKQSSVTAYYSLGKDFYVRVIPATWWDPIGKNNLPTATAYTTMPIRHRITCDTGYLSPEVLGKIESINRTNGDIEISGWACNFTNSSAIKAQLYVYGPAIASSATTTKRTLATTIKPYTYTLIKEVMSNQSSDASVAFKCGKAQVPNKNFKFIIPQADLAKYKEHKFYIKGISNTGGSDKYIDGSGKYWVNPITSTSPESAQF